MKAGIPLLLACAAPLASAMFIRPNLVPVPTLEKNASAYTADHPKEANGWYVLARIHYLAFVEKSDALAASGRPGGLPPTLYGGPYTPASQIAVEQEASRRTLEKLGLKEIPQTGPESQDYYDQVRATIQQLTREHWAPPALAPEELVRHVNESLKAFAKALEIEPDNALYLLGKASLLQQFADARADLEKSGVKDLPPVADKDERAALFYKAFAQAKDKDAKSPTMPMLGLAKLVSFEAGQAYLRLLPDGPKVAEINDHLKTLQSLPPGPVTPIVFSLDPQVTSIQGLLDPGHTVKFDLSGFGRAEAWPWIAPGTSLLVWDPAGSGKIEDGRQLFGTYTWGIFWENGFRALSMLDDNHDGQLTGPELNGLAAWTDRNGDGISTPDEVIPLSKLGIRSIATAPEDQEGVHPHHPAGLTLQDGTTRPVWDWITSGVTPAE